MFLPYLYRKDVLLVMGTKLLLHTMPSKLVRPDQAPKATEHRIVCGAQVELPGHGPLEPSWMHSGRLTYEPHKTATEVFVTDESFALGLLAYLRTQFEPRPARENCHKAARFMTLCVVGRTFPLGYDDQLPHDLPLSPPLETTDNLPAGVHVVHKLEGGYTDAVTGDHIRLAHSGVTIAPNTPDIFQMTAKGGYPALAPPQDWTTHLERRYQDSGPVTVHAVDHA